MKKFPGEPAEYEGMITDWMTHEELVMTFERMTQWREDCIICMGECSCE